MKKLFLVSVCGFLLAGCVDYRQPSSSDMESLHDIRQKKEEYCEKVKHYPRNSSNFNVCVQEEMQLEEAYRARQLEPTRIEQASAEKAQRMRANTPLDALN